MPRLQSSGAVEQLHGAAIYIIYIFWKHLGLFLEVDYFLQSTNYIEHRGPFSGPEWERYCKNFNSNSMGTTPEVKPRDVMRPLKTF